MKREPVTQFYLTVLEGVEKRFEFCINFNFCLYVE
jgi:hypothetical protein